MPPEVRGAGKPAESADGAARHGTSSEPRGRSSSGICPLISRQGGSDIRPLFDFLHFASEFFYFELNLDRSRFLAFLEHLFWFLLYFRYARAQPVFRLV
jgi:hypothetical protein